MVSSGFMTPSSNAASPLINLNGEPGEGCARRLLSQVGFAIES